MEAKRKRKKGTGDWRPLERLLRRVKMRKGRNSPEHWVYELKGLPIFAGKLVGGLEETMEIGCLEWRQEERG